MKAPPGKCGAANAQVLGHIPPSGAYGLCSAGYAPAPASGNGAPWTWSCDDGGGNVNNCVATQATCGTANGQSFSTTAALQAAQMCIPGATATNIAGGGPWSWSCKGADGVNGPASCQASLASSCATNPTMPGCPCPPGFIPGTFPSCNYTSTDNQCPNRYINCDMAGNCTDNCDVKWVGCPLAWGFDGTFSIDPLPNVSCRYLCSLDVCSADNGTVSYPSKLNGNFSGGGGMGGGMLRVDCSGPLYTYTPTQLDDMEHINSTGNGAKPQICH